MDYQASAISPEVLGEQIMDLRVTQREIQQQATREILEIVDAPTVAKQKDLIVHEKAMRRTGKECFTIRQIANQKCRDIDAAVRKLMVGVDRVILTGRQEYLAA